MKKHEQRKYMTPQDTKREKRRRKEGRKRRSMGIRASLPVKVGRSREGWTSSLGDRAPRYHFWATTRWLAEKMERLTKRWMRKHESRVLALRRKVGRGFGAETSSQRPLGRK